MIVNIPGNMLVSVLWVHDSEHASEPDSEPAFFTLFDIKPLRDILGLRGR